MLVARSDTSSSDTAWRGSSPARTSAHPSTSAAIDSGPTRSAYSLNSSRHGKYAGAPPSSRQVAHNTTDPRAAMWAAASPATRVLPIPASPTASIIEPRPARASSAAIAKRSSSQARPTSPCDGTTGVPADRARRLRLPSTATVPSAYDERPVPSRTEPSGPRATTVRCVTRAGVVIDPAPRPTGESVGLGAELSLPERTRPARRSRGALRSEKREDRVCRRKVWRGDQGARFAPGRG